MKWMWWRMNLTRWWWLHNTSPFTFTRCPSCHSTHSASLSSVHCPMLSLTRIFTQPHTHCLAAVHDGSQKFPSGETSGDGKRAPVPPLQGNHRDRGAHKGLPPGKPQEQEVCVETSQSPNTPTNTGPQCCQSTVAWLGRWTELPLLPAADLDTTALLHVRRSSGDGASRAAFSPVSQSCRRGAILCSLHSRSFRRRLARCLET